MQTVANPQSTDNEDDLQLLLILVRERDQHDEKADQQSHKIGEGHEPSVTTSVGCSFLFL